VGTEALDQTVIIEAARLLNVTMRRRAKAVYATHYNQSFADDVLRGIDSLGLGAPAFDGLPAKGFPHHQLRGPIL
jgi:hypothetical protein